MIQIKYDIVGSFLRPEAIKKARAEFKSGAITREDLKKVEDEEIAKLVKKEVEHATSIYHRWRVPPPLVASGLAERVRWI
ncbi:MAG: hypothetical protein ACLT8Y_01145 [Dorea formicigenerans]